MRSRHPSDLTAQKSHFSDSCLILNSHVNTSHCFIYILRHDLKTLRVNFDSYIKETQGTKCKFNNCDFFFSEDFHGIWDSLIFDSDVKAQVRKQLDSFTTTLSRINNYCYQVIHASFVFLLLQLINYAMTTLLFSDRLEIILVTTCIDYRSQMQCRYFQWQYGGTGTVKCRLKSDSQWLWAGLYCHVVYLGQTPFSVVSPSQPLCHHATGETCDNPNNSCEGDYMYNLVPANCCFQETILKMLGDSNLHALSVTVKDVGVC